VQSAKPVVLAYTSISIYMVILVQILT